MSCQWAGGHNKVQGLNQETVTVRHQQDLSRREEKPLCCAESHDKC